MRVTSGSWDGEKVFVARPVPEVRYASADSRLHIARKMKAIDDWDPSVRANDCYGPGVTGNAYDVIDD
jgi:hypothetical protein